MGRDLYYSILAFSGGGAIGLSVETLIGTVADWRWWVIAVPACIAWGQLMGVLRKRSV